VRDRVLGIKRVEGRSTLDIQLKVLSSSVTSGLTVVFMLALLG